MNILFFLAQKRAIFCEIVEWVLYWINDCLLRIETNAFRSIKIQGYNGNSIERKGNRHDLHVAPNVKRKIVSNIEFGQNFVLTIEITIWMRAKENKREREWEQKIDSIRIAILLKVTFWIQFELCK